MTNNNPNSNNNEEEIVTEKITIPTQPPLGSWASVARIMAEEFPDDGFDWDAWKDEMKESDEF